MRATCSALRFTWRLNPEGTEQAECLRWDEMYARVYSIGLQLEPKLQHAATRLAAARPARRLCNRPAVFLRHFRLVLPFPQAEIRRAF
jgi:hypothetical protein